MRNWHPESYSEQARRLANNYLEWENLEEARNSLVYNSTYEGLIRLRACKRFGRKSKEM